MPPLPFTGSLLKWPPTASRQNLPSSQESLLQDLEITSLDLRSTSLIAEPQPFSVTRQTFAF